MQPTASFRIGALVAFAAALFFLAACAGGSGSPSSSSTTYTINGTVSGLSGTLVLQNNTGDDLSTAANGNFTFATAVASGSNYAVTVKTLPSGQTCTVSNGRGAATADISAVSVVCSVTTYNVGVTVSGLTGAVVLQNNGADDLRITANGSYTFSAAVASGSTYAVTVKTQPSGKTCTVNNASDTASANVAGISVVCSATAYSIGGTVSGLSGTVVLQNNSGDDLILTTNGSFTFSTGVTSASTYAVTVKTNPSSQSCTVSGGSGIARTNVSDISVACTAIWSGIKQLGVVSANTNTSAIATDSSGNVYLVGSTNGSLDGSTTTGGYSYAYVAQYNSVGVLEAVKMLGVSGADTNASGIAVNGATVYVSGRTTGGLNRNTLTGLSDAFIAQYDFSTSTPMLISVKQLGATNSFTSANGIAVNGTTVYVAGYTDGGLNGNTMTGMYDAFVAKYDFSTSTPTVSSVQQLGASFLNTFANGVAVNGAMVYVVGSTYGGLDGNLNAGYQDAFVAQYDFSASTPSLTSVKQLGAASSTTSANGVAVNGTTVYVAGITTGGLNGNSMAGYTDAFVARYDFSTSTPSLSSLKQLGTTSSGPFPFGVAVNGTTVYVVGGTNGGLNGNTKTGNVDAFVAQYDFSTSSPALSSVKQLGVASLDTVAEGVAVNGTTVYVAGGTFGGLGGNALNGINDSFVAKYVDMVLQ